MQSAGGVIIAEGPTLQAATIVFGKIPAQGRLSTPYSDCEALVPDRYSELFWTTETFLLPS